MPFDIHSDLSKKPGPNSRSIFGRVRSLFIATFLSLISVILVLQVCMPVIIVLILNLMTTVSTSVNTDALFCKYKYCHR